MTLSRCLRFSTAWVKAQIDRIVISPGPGHPADAGICVDLLRALPAHLPVLGVCLGHQALAVAFGGEVVRAPRPVHGRASIIYHDGVGVFAGSDSPLVAARYHSLAVDEASLTATDLVVTARTPSGIVMGVRHRSRLSSGVQFHPESILTVSGQLMMDRFLASPWPACDPGSS